MSDQITLLPEEAPVPEEITPPDEMPPAPEPIPLTMEEEYDPEGAKRRKWADFVGRELVDFFIEHKLEKLNCEDGFSNKAKLSRTKDDEIKVESSSITIL